jgi:uncharacterized protein (DUF4415 family)
MTYDWMANDEEDASWRASTTFEASVPAALGPDPEPLGEPAKVGRPKGSTTSDRQQVALRMPRDVLDHFRTGGPGWQTRMIAVLRQEMEQAERSAPEPQ